MYVYLTDTKIFILLMYAHKIMYVYLYDTKLFILLLKFSLHVYTKIMYVHISL